jgi:hypothetical protein
MRHTYRKADRIAWWNSVVVFEGREAESRHYQCLHCGEVRRVEDHRLIEVVEMREDILIPEEPLIYCGRWDCDGAGPGIDLDPWWPDRPSVVHVLRS